MSTVVEHLLQHKGRRVLSVPAGAKIADAVEVLGKNKIGAVLVCDGPRLVGLISERDCVRAVLWERRVTLESSVEDLMTVNLVTVGRQDTISHCMTLMNGHRIRHLPVVEEGVLLGLVSVGDVINGLLRDQQALIDSYESYVSGHSWVPPR